MTVSAAQQQASVDRTNKMNRSNQIKQLTSNLDSYYSLNFHEDTNSLLFILIITFIAQSIECYFLKLQIVIWMPTFSYS